MTSEIDCKRLLFKIGMEIGVSPNLVSKRLLDALDKQLMLSGELDYDIIRVAVICWMNSGVPDYANGSTEPLDWSYSKELKNRLDGST